MKTKGGREKGGASTSRQRGEGKRGRGEWRGESSQLCFFACNLTNTIALKVTPPSSSLSVLPLPRPLLELSNPATPRGWLDFSALSVKDWRGLSRSSATHMASLTSLAESFSTFLELFDGQFVAEARAHGTVELSKRAEELERSVAAHDRAVVRQKIAPIHD